MLLHANFNPASPDSYLGPLWFTWVAVWMLASFASKRTRTRESVSSRLLYGIPIIFAALLLFSPALRAGFLVARFLPQMPALQWVGVVLTVLGIVFTFWARFHIGRNWSGQVVIKEQHELIRSGPYAWVRHPIYTGLLSALLGTALVLGEVRALLALLLATFHFYRKAKREEGFMSQEFGEQYAEYRRHTAMLVPRPR
jgi:protein-S-isoprenylcysteine O-methyltransferase Ste14